MRTFLGVVVAAAATIGTAAAENAAALPRVRPTDPMARAALDRGRHQSPTFARLVEELERSTVIVHVETSLRLRPTIGGQFFFVTEGADGSRFLRIRLNAHAGAVDLTARLGHELQHAVEVARTVVRDSAGMARLYRAIGSELEPGVFDTAAAHDVEARVTTELLSRRVPVPAARGGWTAARASCPAGWVTALLW
jgi:hypothetical protein